RYWSLPADPPLVLASPGEYADAFRDVLAEAVRDRLGVDRAAILLSGGRDSTAVGALAAEMLRDGRETARITAHTLSGGVPADREADYAAVAAGAFGFPHRVHSVDGHRLFDRLDEPGVVRPQPLAGALLSIDADLNRALAADARVALTGDGGDPVLAESESRLALLWTKGMRWQALGEALEYARRHRRVPRPGIRTLRRGGAAAWTAAIPPWMDAEAAARLGVAGRWERWSRLEPSGHPLRPEAHARVASTFWPWWLEQYDAGSTRVPLEFRHPFLDLRVVRFALSVPPAQWYNDKGLLRIGMRGRIPGRVLRRSKTPLAYDPLLLRLRDRGERPADALHPAVAALVDAGALPTYAGGSGPDDWTEAAVHLRPLILSHWLRAGFPPAG
ncbi:MAG TPA: asparagine synthase C-terminal domain-containing protein, partial [Longimicrobiaceae bacterium]|nr:asparagine synthase C-terminal domain-containing protein [Longimicrobiaceae bacterium]